MAQPNNPPSDNSRREFIRTSTAAVVGGAVALAAPATVHAAGNDTLKIALIGCGGRGKGAAKNAINADPNVELTVIADLFPDRLASARSYLQQSLGDKMKVDNDHAFSGFDAYEKVMQTDVDVVLLCTPPHFRPMQLKAAIDAGKHVFCEKPVAVDAPGVASVRETCALARKKNLTVVSGLCWRYDLGVKETIGRIKDGAIGDIVAIQENYLTGTLWHRDPKPGQVWSPMEQQLRNWMYYTWLSGDHIVEQHIHSLDKALWLMDDKPPAKVFGLGGRQVRTGKQWGHIYDHFAVCYEWANGVKTYAYTRQMAGCRGDVNDYVLGTKGKAAVLSFSIDTPEKKWKYPSRSKPSMYDLEHKALFAGLRKGEHINNGEYMCDSTLMAIIGREACYTGATLSWDQMKNSQTSLGPKSYDFNAEPPAVEIAKPGKTKFV